MDENKKNGADIDDFWNLSDLVPRRKSAPSTAAEPRSIEPVMVRSVTPPSSQNSFADVPLTERFVSPQVAEELRRAPKPERSYVPEGTLLREVRIYPWKNEYTYYEQFRRHAERLAAREGKPCPEVDFFSYMPQYTQLSLPQLEYYLWWRTCFRRGECLPAAYSYLLLYLYELINLDECHQNPQTGCENMVKLWLSYREKHPRLDALIREWLCDFCLLHQLPPPRLEPSLYRTLLGGCKLKEFYVRSAESGQALGRALLLFCNNYDYTKSKFYRPDTKEDYDRVLGGAIEEAVAFLKETGGEHLTDAGGVSTVSRDTFQGAICSYKLKRRIEVDYTSFSHTHELRFIMTDVLKYAENALRQNRGIKSRLSIYAISVPLRARLDAYLSKALPPRSAHPVQKKQEIPDYEKHYDLPFEPLSAERAAEIEAESWQTTKRLVEAFDAAENEFPPITVQENGNFSQITPRRTDDALPAERTASLDAAAPPTAGQAPACGGDGAERPAGRSALAESLGPLAAFLSLARSADRAAQRDFAREQGMMPDAIAEKINTVTGDMMGDIVLEECDGAYVIIEDYLEFLQEQGVL